VSGEKRTKWEMRGECRRQLTAQPGKVADKGLLAFPFSILSLLGWEKNCNHSLHINTFLPSDEYK
jgi:hypothetical protein